jgi:hypothetical protein
VSGFREWSAFEPFVERRDGIVYFANRMLGRHMPGFPGSTAKRRRWKKRRRTFRQHRMNIEIDRASDLAAARRWLPGNPLGTYAMRAEDAVIARRRGQRAE